MAERADGPRRPLELLLEVQECDLRLDRLGYQLAQLPERAALAAVEERLRLLAVRRDERERTRRSHATRQADIEHQVEAISSRIGAIEARSLTTGAYRDLQAMSAENESLSRQRRLLEDEELEVMEQLEPVEAELATVSAEIADAEKERAVVSSALAAATAELDAQIAVVRSERESLAEGLPPQLRATYERLRERLGGIGAARLADGSCTGCHLHLPSGERERIARAGADEVVFCEQCGRILVP